MEWRKIEATVSRISEYQRTKYLTMAKGGSKTIPVGDIGTMAKQGDRNDELWVINVTVAGVPYFDHR